MAIDAVFEALAHPVRRKILHLLAEGSLNAGAIASHFTLTKPTLSAHFNKLRQAELVTAERRGTSVVYSLNPSILEAAIAAMMALQDPGSRP